jgi:hypothetical protein
MFAASSRVFEWGACSDDEESQVDTTAAAAAPEEPEDDGFQEVKKTSRPPRGARPESTILVFKDAYSNPTYEYTGLVVSHVSDLERLFSVHDSRRFKKQQISYAYEFYHGYSVDTQVVQSFHHGRAREYVKLKDEELARYEDKIKGYLKLYTKKTCNSCDSNQLYDLNNNKLLCFPCHAVRAKHKSKSKSK